jgi:alkaline phosphatase
MNKLLILATAATLAACTSVDSQVAVNSLQNSANAVAVSQQAEVNQWYSQGQAAVAQRANIPLNTNKAKNVILFIADGMGISTITATRIYDGQSRGRK